MPKLSLLILSFGLLLTWLFPSALPAATPGQQDTYTFSAPPWESATEGKAKYEPIAEYLSNVTGKKVVYQYPGSWDGYRKNMTQGKYDIVFDSAHFNDYRATKLNHKIIVKAPDLHRFVVIVRKDNKRYRNINQLVGRTICTQSPPDLSTLMLLKEFTNPVRQPSLVSTKGWRKIYQGVQSGRCIAGILPIGGLQKMDKGLLKSKIVYRAKPMPNQAFSVGPRVKRIDQVKIAGALTSPDAYVPTSKLRQAFSINGKRFILTSNKEYAGMANYLKDQWGYY